VTKERVWIGLKRLGTTNNYNAITNFRQILEKKWEYNETVHELFIDFKKACDSVRREVLYNILIEFGVPMKLIRLIRIKRCGYIIVLKVRFLDVAKFTTLTPLSLQILCKVSFPLMKIIAS
jgi:hypothetical protein